MDTFGDRFDLIGLIELKLSLDQKFFDQKQDT